MSLLLSGCQSPLEIYHISQETFIATMKVSIQLKEQGKIDDEKWTTIIQPAVAYTNLLLDKMKLAAINDDTDIVKRIAFEVSDICRQIREFNDEHSGNSSTVRPSYNTSTESQGGEKYP